MGGNKKQGKLQIEMEKTLESMCLDNQRFAAEQRVPLQYCIFWTDHCDSSDESLE